MNGHFSCLVSRIISTMMSARTSRHRFPPSLHTSACVLPLASKEGKWAAFSCRLPWRSQRSRSRSCSICTLSTRVQALPAQVSPWSEMKLGGQRGCSRQGGRLFRARFQGPATSAAALLSWEQAAHFSWQVWRPCGDARTTRCWKARMFC
jgi:hypothetical protein